MITFIFPPHLHDKCHLPDDAFEDAAEPEEKEKIGEAAGEDDQDDHEDGDDDFDYGDDENDDDDHDHGDNDDSKYGKCIDLK